MNKFFNRFLFDQSKNIRARILLAVFLISATVCTLYISRNPENFINADTNSIELNLANVSDEVIAATSPTASEEQKQAAVAAVEKKKAATGIAGSTTPANSSSTIPSGSETTPSAPAQPESDSAFVAFYADNQSDSNEDDARHSSVTNRILDSGGNPVLHAGDIMEDGTEASWNRFLNVAGTLLGSRTFYAALGNNDRVAGDSSTPSPYFLSYFNFPNNKQWYSVNSGNLHIVFLDSAFSSGSATQLSWLASDLQSEASQSRITVVIFHHPTFASNISSYLQNYGVDFVVAGHIHTYTKSTVGGATMFTLPGGTAIGYATAQVFDSYAIFRTYDINGSLIETSQISER